jgi:hypothetical protein
MDLKGLASRAITTANGCNVFDTFHQLVDNYHNTPCHSIAELKEKNTKLKGDIFEQFCCLYLQHVYGLTHVALFKDVPQHVLTDLNFRYKGDFGIDIIGFKDGIGWYAIQCKYRQFEVKSYQHHRTDVIGWKEVSTFHALCAKTGPWVKNIVMTTGSSVRRITGKTDVDLSLCKGTFRNITLDQWYTMFGIVGDKQEVQVTNRPSKEELRNIRAKFYI